MKKLILILSCLFIGVGLFGQDRYVKEKQTNVYIDGVAADTASSASESIIKSISLSEKQWLQIYTVTVGLDSVSGTTGIPTYLQKSYDAGVNWIDIDTITFNMTVSDTAIVFQDISTGTDAPLIRTKSAGKASTKVKLDYIYYRLLNKQ